MIQEMTVAEIEQVDGAALSATQYVTYTLIAGAAVAVGVATGGAGLVLAGTFLGAMTEVLK